MLTFKHCAVVVALGLLLSCGLRWMPNWIPIGGSLLDCMLLALARLPASVLVTAKHTDVGLMMIRALQKHFNPRPIFSAPDRSAPGLAMSTLYTHPHNPAPPNPANSRRQNQKSPESSSINLLPGTTTPSPKFPNCKSRIQDDAQQSQLAMNHPDTASSLIQPPEPQPKTPPHTIPMKTINHLAKCQIWMTKVHFKLCSN